MFQHMGRHLNNILWVRLGEYIQTDLKKIMKVFGNIY